MLRNLVTFPMPECCLWCLSTVAHLCKRLRQKRYRCKLSKFHTSNSQFFGSKEVQKQPPPLLSCWASAVPGDRTSWRKPALFFTGELTWTSWTWLRVECFVFHDFPDLISFCQGLTVLYDFNFSAYFYMKFPPFYAHFQELTCWVSGLLPFLLRTLHGTSDDVDNHLQGQSLCAKNLVQTVALSSWLIEIQKKKH